MNRRLSVLGAATLGALLAWTPRADAQPARGHEIDQKQLCAECHDLENEGASVQHAPVEAGECSACHNPHVARFQNLLRDRPGPLCASCHEDVQGADHETVHAPVAEGRCADCHDPHGSEHRGLLVESSETLCVTCHEDVASWKERGVQHAPFAQGRCSTCHDPHSSDGPGLLAKSGAQLCTSCHQMDAALRRKHGGRPVEQAACHQCHDPHASAQKGLFRESIHAPFAAGDCATCHPVADAPDPFATNKPIGPLCAECHADAVEASQHASFPHVSAGGGRCVECHNPHTGHGTALLRKAAPALCTDCHDPGGSSSGEDGRHLTHSGFECTTCHASHGAEQPLLFVDDSVEVCGTCHTHEHGIRHPLGEDTKDPRTGNPMTCLSCHGIHRAEGEWYLFEADQRMLCIGCHKDLQGR